MKSTGIGAGVGALLLLCCAPAAADAACKLQTLAEYHVTIVGNQPLIDAQIDGNPVRFIMDLGAARTSLFSAGVDKLGLERRHTSAAYYGAGGAVIADAAHLQTLAFGAAAAKGVDLPVMPGGAKDSDVVGLLGEDFLTRFDLELDFAHNALRLFKPDGCPGDEVVYWGGGYSVARALDGLLVEVKLNGQNLYALLDSGAAHSYVTLDAARRAGVTPRSPGVRDGKDAHGIGPSVVVTKVADFASFSIGDEAIKNLSLPIGDLFQADKVYVTGSHVMVDPVDWPEMLIGVDFMKAHRIYIAQGQGKVYFSYVGGPVFDEPAKAP